MPVWSLENPCTAGKIIKPHSYLGLVKVAFLFSGLDEVLVPGAFLFIEWMEKPVPYLIEEIYWDNDDSARVKLADINNEEEAAKLRGRNVIISEAEIPEPEDEEPEENECTGYKVLDIHDGTDLGIVMGIITAGPQTLFEVTLKGHAYMIPIHEDLIKRIKHHSKIILVDLPEGLTDL